MRVVTATALVGLFVMTASAAAPMSGVGGAESTQDVIVVFHDDVGDPAELANVLTRAHGGELRFVYQHAIKGFSASLPASAVAAIEQNPQVAFINENRPVEAFEDSVPTGVSRIDGPVAHSNSVTGGGVRVAIIDTGIDSNHEDLPNVDFASGYNCIDPGASPEDDQGHGTHVAGTVAAADNGLGVIGVAPAATLIPVKVLNSSGNGTWEQVICGIDHITGLNTDGVASNDIHVANMSLGGSGSHDGTTCGQSTDAMYQAICGAIVSGTTFVVAAGNDATNADGFVPAAYPEVITVSAYSDTDGSTNDAGCTGFAIFVTCDEVFAPFSNYGDIVDVIAPGVNINSTTYDGGYGTKSGTSMASPHAAGVAALVLQQNPGLSASQVEAHLRDFGQCPDTLVNGAGNDDCPSGQGEWKNDPESFTEPMAHAAYATGSSADTNTPPVAADVNETTDEDTSVAITLSGSDAETCELSFSIVSGPSNGSLGGITDSACTGGIPNSDTATVIYTPNANYNGSDLFTYRVSDGSATDDGTVTVTVNAVNDAPVANHVSASGVMNTIISWSPDVSDVDNDSLTCTIVEPPLSGTAAVAADCSSGSYEPPPDATGEFTFTYKANDGTVDSNTATVTINVGSATTMHVGDLEAVASSSGSSWTATVTILVLDNLGNPVDGATVSGTWTLSDSGATTSCITGSSGTCTVSSGGIHKRNSSTTWSVTGISHGSLTYDFTANTDADGDSDGTSITVLKP
ncbi:MAG TPA: S8 family serine peptidase [Acidimicrobiia bacterium]|nr:S8 family serine peptidase [Acidimicrobiia bacterium]